LNADGATQERGWLVERLLEPLDELAEEYSRAGVAVDLVIGSLRELSRQAVARAAAERDSLDADQPSASPRGPRVDEGQARDVSNADVYGVLEFHAALSRLKGVASVMTAEAADGQPVFVVTLEPAIDA
jgi:hypothetical protein